MNRLAQMNPGMMARLMRRGQPGQQAPPQNYGGIPAPQVPFQGGQPGGQPPPQAAGPGGMGAGGDPAGGMPDMAMMGDALKKIFGGPETSDYGAQTDAMVQSGMVPPEGMPSGSQTGGMDKEKLMGILKMLPTLMGG